MRVLLSVLFFVITIVGGNARSPSPKPPRPPAPTSFVCSSATASSLGTTITNTINNALLPKADNSNTTSKDKSLWSFTIAPNVCVGNPFGYGLFPKTCTDDNGATAGMSTVKTKTVTGAYDLKVNVEINQTYCSTSNKTSGGTFVADANWPSITFEGSTGVKFDLIGQTLDLAFETTLTNLAFSISGDYGYNVTASTNQLCVTNLVATNVVLSVGDVSVKYGVGSPTTSAPNVANKIENKINSSSTASNVETDINKALAEVNGKCKTIGTPNPPFPSFPPRSPRSFPPPRPKVG